MSRKSIALECALAAPFPSQQDPGNDPSWLLIGTEFLESLRREDEDMVDTRAWDLLLNTFYLFAMTEPETVRDAAIKVAGQAIAFAESVSTDEEVTA